MKFLNDHREKLMRITAHTSWWLAALSTLVMTQFPQDHPVRHYTIVIVLFIGFAIASGLGLSRMKLADTMKNVYGAGYSQAAAADSKRARQANEEAVKATEQLLNNQEMILSKLHRIEYAQEAHETTSEKIVKKHVEEGRTLGIE